MKDKMRSKLERLGDGMLAPMNPYVSVVLGTLTFLWGLLVIVPNVDTFSTAEVYYEILNFMPEWAWGLIAICCGTGVLAGVYYAIAKPLAYALGATTWLWYTIAGFMWWSDWHNTGGLTYTFIGIYSSLAFLNIRANYVNQGIKHI